jgi:hypothetical protein
MAKKKKVLKKKVEKKKPDKKKKLQKKIEKKTNFKHGQYLTNKGHQTGNRVNDDE